MKNILKILLIILLTSCATITATYDDAYYTQEQTINFVPRIYYHYIPPLIFYWDYPYLGWQYNRYCGYYWCYSCYPYCYYPNWYYPYYYWSWYDFNTNHYFGRRYLPSPKPNYERQVQRYNQVPNQRTIVPNRQNVQPNQRQAAPRYVAPQQKYAVPQRSAPQNNPIRIQSNQNKSYIYNRRSVPQPQRTNPVQTAPKIGVRTK